MHFSREGGAEPSAALEIPQRLDAGAVLVRVEGAAQRDTVEGIVNVDPAAAAWTAFWGS
jgi:hypothetical protein